MIGICVRRREHVSCAYHAYQFAHQKVITPESIRFIGCQRYVTWQKTLFTCGQLLLVYLVASLCVVCCLRCALFKYQTVWNFISQLEQLCEESILCVLKSFLRLFTTGTRTYFQRQFEGL